VIGPDGGTSWISSTKVPLRGEIGEAVGLVSISRDMTARKFADRLRDGQARILEMIATNARLDEIPDRLTRLIESQLAGVRSSVLLLDEDGVRLRNGAAPSLPEDLLQAIDGLAIGLMVGSFGAAEWRREPIVVTDVATDPRWANYRALAEEHGFRS
jgi:GAF domain-containing protein